MKTKIFILAALLSVAAMSANAGVRFGISVGLPLPVVVSSPVVYAPAPVTVVQTILPCRVWITSGRPVIGHISRPAAFGYPVDGIIVRSMLAAATTVAMTGIVIVTAADTAVNDRLHTGCRPRRQPFPRGR